MSIEFSTPGGPVFVDVSTAIVAGWTGRDRAGVDHHIAELAALGVAPPSDVPLFYRVSPGLLTQDDSIQILGEATSGEVEPLVIRTNGQLWLGLGSDHTDRALEATSVAASKQVCAKPVCTDLWPLSDVAGHLDQLTLFCEIEDGGAWVDYQSGTLAQILPLPDLIDQAALPDNAAMLCGTLPAIGGVRPASRYRMTLEDPVLERSIRLAYTASTLPIVA